MAGELAYVGTALFRRPQPIRWPRRARVRGNGHPARGSALRRPCLPGNLPARTSSIRRRKRRSRSSPTHRRATWSARSNRPEKGSRYGATPPPMSAAGAVESRRADPRARHGHRTHGSTFRPGAPIEIRRWNDEPLWSTLPQPDEKPEPRGRDRVLRILTPTGNADPARPPIRFPAVGARSGPGRSCCSSTGD